MKIQNSKFKMQNCSSKFKVLLRILFICLTFNFALLTFNSEKANAASLSLSIDPSIIEINALPPSVATATLSIQNKSNDQVQLRILFKPFKARLENGELEYVNPQDSFVAKNVRILDDQVPVEEIVLAPRQQKNLTLNINIPQNSDISARPPASSPMQSEVNQAGVAGEVGRDYYFSIVFISQNTASSTSTSSFNQLGIVSNVLLSIGTKEVPEGVIEEFSAGLFYESGPVPFTLRIKNKDTHFIKPKGEILIKNMFGQNIGKLDLVSVNILSDSTRAIPNTIYMQELRSADKQKSNLSFQNPKTLWKEDFLLGFYTATLNISLSQDGPSFTKSIRFFALPFQGLIVIVIVLISAIIIVNRVRARMNK